MGACLGHCLAKITDSMPHRFYQRHTRMSFQEEDQAEFMDVEREEEDQTQGSKSLLSFLSLKKFKKKHGVPVTLELLEDGGWSRGGNRYARLSSRNDVSTSSGLDISLQVLDARTLMKQQTYVSSTPGSSLDLEWEHEGNLSRHYVFLSLLVHRQIIAGMPLPIIEDDKGETEGSVTSVNNSQPSSLTASPWSRVSSPNSLEWDPVEPDMVCVDMDTEQLLTEIERLTDRALKETGEWTSTDS
ncbi:uncharacterized protein [Linepithema humile]|uniref:uncharacterized protein isoform X1 n=1 Tax=Linepithema humile TaxID=83485 RepID=UPI0006237B24|nr:PREDICTED: uncharacterized protein LOC105671961 isoform X1 [Linepithema humile]XP_012221968.1 PREDICTED: uncharacterized protein LOC105671961 isoform X1 [Linepithema humile]XP_012221969.1 PREDICTED: uncharacterized protein LOC105671961 isoform X1 [Linepithema humile]XP_012221970.1 PREDICTED: uncharacterized protein LOC105671961 isoform X1 [Linepithema humile]